MSTAQDIMVPIDMITVSIEEEAENASRKVLHSGRSAIVETEGEPSAILSLKGSRRLLHQPGTLSDHYLHLRVIGQALSNATIPDLALAMAFDPTIDAFVVLDANKPVGLITMHRLFRVVASRVIPSLGPDWSFVNAPSNLPGQSCYCCPKIPHQVAPGNIKKDANRLALCPTHNQYLIVKVPCNC